MGLFRRAALRSVIAVFVEPHIDALAREIDKRAREAAADKEDADAAPPPASDRRPRVTSLLTVADHRRTVALSYVFRDVPDGAWHYVWGNAAIALCGAEDDAFNGDTETLDDVPEGSHHEPCRRCLAERDAMVLAGLVPS